MPATRSGPAVTFKPNVRLGQRLASKISRAQNPAPANTAISSATSFPSTKRIAPAVKKDTHRKMKKSRRIHWLAADVDSALSAGLRSCSLFERIL